MSSYAVLEALPPEAYLNAADPVFLSGGSADRDSAYRAKQFAAGLRYGAIGTLVVSIRGTWSVACDDGSSVSSSEGIGYHAATDALLAGFLASGCPIKVYRYIGGVWSETDVRAVRVAVAA